MKECDIFSGVKTYSDPSYIFSRVKTAPTPRIYQICGLRPSVVGGQDRSASKKIGLGLGLASCGLGLGLAVLVLFCETRSCNARRHNDLEGHSNFSSTIFSLFCA